MKKIGHFLKSKSLQKKIPLDDKSIAYVFNRIIKEEYGNRGMESIKIKSFDSRKLFIKTKNSNWENELILDKALIIERINRELGSFEIDEIVLSK